MRRVLFIVLLAAGCSRGSPAAREMTQKLKELDVVAREFAAARKEVEPLEKLFLDARQKGDRAEMQRIQEQATPALKRTEMLDKKQDALVKQIRDLAESGLQKKPDDADVLDARVRLLADYPPQPDPRQPKPDDTNDKLLADTEKLLGLRPGDREATVRRACALRRSGRYPEARALLADVLKAAPGHARARAEDGLSAFCVDDYDGAVPHLEAASQHESELPPSIGMELAQTLPSARDRVAHWQKERELRRRDEGANLPQVRFVTSRGEILMELFEDDAPNTVANFVHLVESRFYDGTRFHRVIPDFMAQGGDPNSRDDNPKNDGQGGPGYTFKDELDEGKYRRHFRGSFSMANSGPNTNGSQFYITHRPTQHLDGRHTVFGRILSGLDVVERLATGDELKEAVVVRRRDHPYRPLVDK